jgi:hypothetical protein
MSEREYVEHIRRVAEEYLHVIKQEGRYDMLHSKQAKSWQNCTQHLPARLTIAMCNAWLDAAQDSRGDAVMAENPNTADK